MVKYQFRKLDDVELDKAYNIHCELVNDMINRGIKQWLKPIDKEKLIERQKKKENFGLFGKKNELKVFLSLVERIEYYEWSSWFTKNKTTIWLNTVSVNTANESGGLGRIAIEKSINYLKNQSIKELYLDCVINEGFLVTYYEKIGFKKIGEKRVKYRSGTFDVALMKYIIIQ